MDLTSYSWLSLVLFALFNTVQCACRRLGGTKCSTADGACSLLFHDDGSITQIGWPSPKQVNLTSCCN